MMPGERAATARCREDTISTSALIAHYIGVPHFSSPWGPRRIVYTTSGSKHAHTADQDRPGPSGLGAAAAQMFRGSRRTRRRINCELEVTVTRTSLGALMMSAA